MSLWLSESQMYRITGPCNCRKNVITHRTVKIRKTITSVEIIIKISKIRIQN